MTLTSFYPPWTQGLQTRPLRRAINLALFVYFCRPWSIPAGEIVIVQSSNATPYQATVSALRAALNKNEHRSRSFLLGELTPQQLGELAKSGADFFAVGTRSAVFLKKRLPQQTLLAYCMVADPEDKGLTGRKNTLGIRTDAPLVEQFRLIANTLREKRRVGILYRSSVGASRERLQQVRAILPAQWQLEAVDVDRYSSFADSLSELFRRRPDVIWTAADSSVYSSPSIRALLLAAVRNKTPVFGFSAPVVRAGALFGIAVDPVGQGKRVASLYHQLVIEEATPSNGSKKPADLGAEKAHLHSEIHVSVNLIVAEKLGVDLSENVIRRAKYVFGKRGRP